MEKPLYGVEVFVGETARFEIELSEPDVHGQWKLKGEPLTASPVSEHGRADQIGGCRLFFQGPPPLKLQLLGGLQEAPYT